MDNRTTCILYLCVYLNNRYCRFLFIMLLGKDEIKKSLK